MNGREPAVALENMSRFAGAQAGANRHRGKMSATRPSNADKVAPLSSRFESALPSWSD